MEVDMLHLVAYDIGNPHRLRRVARICEDYGIRMEKSVFECDLEDGQMEQFWRQLSEAVNEDEDRVFDYRIGAVERRNIRRLGHFPETPDAAGILIL